jgi:hypothetical protein
MAAVARFSELPWYRRVLEVWTAEVNYKPDWFALAWSVRLAKAPQHAVMIADVAVAAFPDDRAFQEERAFMKELLRK